MSDLFLRLYQNARGAYSATDKRSEAAVFSCRNKDRKTGNKFLNLFAFDASYAWYVNFNSSGNVNNNGKNNAYYVRCVRP